MEEEFEVKTYLIRYICDECKDGELVFTGEVVTIYPALYIHKCDKCGAIKKLKESYPTYRYKRIIELKRR